MGEPRQIGGVEVRVDLPADRVFFCEGQQKFVRWVEDFWPLYCPICGRGVHKQLSTHHEMIVNGGEAPDPDCNNCGHSEGKHYFDPEYGLGKCSKVVDVGRICECPGWYFVGSSDE